MYEINYDERSQTLHLKLTGFWTEATMASFKNDFTILIQKLTRARTSFVVLSDCRNYPVQSHEVLAAWAEALGPKPIVSVPYAVIVGSVLNKLQAERALTASNVQVFASIETAKAWLEASGGTGRSEPAGPATGTAGA